MASVSEHYENVLSRFYSWLYGGFAVNLKKNSDFFIKNDVVSKGSGIAVDLGAGCGFYAIPLAELGFSVNAIDLDEFLLKELKNHRGDNHIDFFQGDLINFEKFVQSNVELAICMTDTILHLESKEKVALLFKKVSNALEANGRFILSFRDLTLELTDLDRFLPVRSDENIIFTCFLEYEPETVKVNDIIYRKTAKGWDLLKSYYRKLRLSRNWVEEHLFSAGLTVTEVQEGNGFITIFAQK